MWETVRVRVRLENQPPSYTLFDVTDLTMDLTISPLFVPSCDEPISPLFVRAPSARCALRGAISLNFFRD